jgi:putative hydrolase of the HAD superfamily
MALPAAILLDLDDTIVAGDVAADECWKSLCTQYAPEVGIDADNLLASIRRSRDWFWSDAERHKAGRRDLRYARSQIVNRAFSELQLDHASTALRLADQYGDERERLLRVFPGALETVAELRRRGVDLALITNGEARSQRSKIERFDLARHFKCILIEGEFGVGKPDHAVFTHALNALGRRPEETWMIGDSLTFDIAPAVQLGMHAIWVDHAGAGLPEDCTHKPARIISALAEIAVAPDHRA